MDIFITNIVWTTTPNQLQVSLANVLHGQDYRHHRVPVTPMNLSVFIHPRRGHSATRTGILTVPTEAVGTQFLFEFGGPNPMKRLVLGQTLRFQPSRSRPKPHILEKVRRMPYEDPRLAEEQEKHNSELRAHTIPLSAIQFGWECRDNVYSIEWEKDCLSSRCELTFDTDRREFRVKFHGPTDIRIIAIRASQVNWVSAGLDASSGTSSPIIYMSLYYPPAFESEQTQSNADATESLLTTIARMFGNLNLGTQSLARQRWSYFDFTHDEAGVARFTSQALRFVCRSSSDLRIFRGLCRASHTKLDDFIYPVERRGLFAQQLRDRYNAWVSLLPWSVAFQLEALLCSSLLDFREMLELRQRIEKIYRDHRQDYTISFLQHLGAQAKTAFCYTEEGVASSGTFSELFDKCYREYTPRVQKRRRRDPHLDTFNCLHVTITPTSIHLQGPYPERSNRVIRAYPGHHDSFLRVNFVDETELHFRFDRDIDGRSFISRRVGAILANGIDVAGRHFDFLAYSQSALREHAVWFVKEFRDLDGNLVNARSIIAGIGTFDSELLRCPARYGARISQAFTATDSSVTIEPEEIFIQDDIKDPTGRWDFTDGVGTITAELARDIWKVLRSRRRGSGRSQDYPRAFQIRLNGSKGMLSVDHRLTGRVITLRPSMIKFEAQNNNLEIARAFHKPGPFYLNRPFIMILESLGVPYEVFEDLQRSAVQQAQQSTRSLESSARLLEVYGLGASYRLTSVMLSLHKLGLRPLTGNNFWERMMAFAIHHVLRELKHHARIPVPNAWNLVGVADIHGYLEEGEVFACIEPTNGTGPIYLDGPVMISRSPTIHPGDVQVVRGIGAPPPGSPFAIEPLRNTLVFSVKGSRPLPSYLGGGDLDGDEYRVTMIESLMPTRTFAPADYTPAPKKTLDRPSTMQDVADFVVDYINSDTLGIIAITWLIIADQSTLGIHDPDCLELSALHSDAVDYPKSGQPVNLSAIPKLKFKIKPDWNAPETSVDLSRFYESQKAIGRLFRDIQLPEIDTARRAQNAQRRHLSDNASLEDIIEAFKQPVQYEDGSVSVEVALRVSEFVRIGAYDDDLVAEVWEQYTRYVSELRGICADFTLSYGKDAMLTEEEVVVGTIVAPCPQPRRRRDFMSQMREQATTLVDSVRYDLSGEEGTLPERSLQRSWVAYRLAEIKEDTFGARSFAWIALGEIFEAIRVIEDTEGYY
ncbi:hypothetical protein EIP86_002965 [Pleurotus ostreatoroseus]|nr:hypothetical protein EIP86_002965 [Pleurotus ostreatoroseus]